MSTIAMLDSGGDVGGGGTTTCTAKYIDHAYCCNNFGVYHKCQTYQYSNCSTKLRDLGFSSSCVPKPKPTPTPKYPYPVLPDIKASVDTQCKSGVFNLKITWKTNYKSSTKNKMVATFYLWPTKNVNDVSQWFGYNFSGNSKNSGTITVPIVPSNKFNIKSGNRIEVTVYDSNQKSYDVKTHAIVPESVSTVYGGDGTFITYSTCQKSFPF